MKVIAIILSVLFVAMVIAIIAASRKIVKDDNNNKIPDWLEEKLADLKEEIKNLKK